MSRRIRSVLLACLLPVLGALALAAPASATTVTFDDPFEAQPYVADLGRTTATYAEDRVLTVATQIVARPPAGWGGCVPHRSGVCVPAQMSVSWLLDYWVGGDPLEFGADTRVVATPSAGQTTWTSARWDRYNHRWEPAAVPTGATDIDGATWRLPLEELGLVQARPAWQPREDVALTVISRFRALDADGAPVEGTDAAGPMLLRFGALTQPDASAPGGAPKPPLPEGDGPAERRAACRYAKARGAKLAKRIRRATRAAHRRGPAARRRAARAELRRLRRELRAVQATKRRTCATASQPPSH